MSEAEASREYQRWLRYAQEDLEAAALFTQNPTVAPRHACFLAQQSAEKAIKSILIFLHVEFPYVHDLKMLLTLVPDDWQLKHNDPGYSQLSLWAVTARYPDVRDEPSIDAAMNAIQAARTIFELVVEDLRQRGFVLDGE